MRQSGTMAHSGIGTERRLAKLGLDVGFKLAVEALGLGASSVLGP